MNGKLHGRSRLKTVRDIIACSVFIMSVLLFMDWGGLFSGAFGFIAKLQLWPAVLAVNVGILVLIIAMTMVFGRVYCSVLCPWGLLQDGILRSDIAIRRFLSRFGRRLPRSGGKLSSSGPGRKFSRARALRLSLRARNWIRYSVLAVYLSLIAFGLGSVAYLIEPYSNFGVLMSVVKGKTGLYSAFSGALLPVTVVALVTLTVLVAFVVIGGRLWCNTLCPVGAVLGLLGRRSLFRPVIDEGKCVSCGLCARGCRASCIDVKNHSVDMSSCVMCLDCIDTCHTGAIEYKWSFGRRYGEQAVPESSRPAAGPRASAAESRTPVAEPQTPAAESSAAMSRRSFLAVTALGVWSVASAQMSRYHLDALQDKIPPERMTPLVPPGAASLKNFNSRCIGCQLCVSVCPNKVLRPAVTFDSFMKPVMSYEAGFCRPECTSCSDVCPTGAIVKVTVEQKSSISIGHAEYNPFACVVNTDGVSCGNCARHCPTGAITMVKPQDSWNDFEIPAIDTERCIGCGHCEYVCPARPQSAIYVEGNEVHRII